MSDTYTKLFRSIATSTIVEEPLPARWLWVILLSQADARGVVYASVPGLARLANLSIADVESALDRLAAPDPYSRTKDHEGRRLEVIDGGWRLLNHAKYAAMRSAEERAAYKREWDRKNRPSGHPRQSDSSPTVRQQSDTKGPKSDSPTPPTPTPTPEEQQLPVPEHTPRSERAREVCEDGVTESPPDRGKPATPMREALAPATEASIALRQASVTVTPYHPDLVAACAEGVTPAELVALAGQYPGKPAAYVIAAARRQRADGAKPVTRHPRDGPQRDTSAIGRVRANNREALEGHHDGQRIIDIGPGATLRLGR